MPATHALTTRPAARRSAFAALTALLLVAAIAGAVVLGAGWWQLVAFGLGPDLALLAGMGAGLAKGQLHPRAVPLYNALHSYWGPALLALATVVLPAGFLIGALAWAFHISLDRTIGYGMRTRAGFQRA
jgi:hypothetical protein